MCLVSWELWHSVCKVMHFRHQQSVIRGHLAGFRLGYESTADTLSVRGEHIDTYPDKVLNGSRDLRLRADC